MANHSAQTGHDEALAMLHAFASTGATHFDVTWTKADGQPLRYDEAVGLADLARTLPAILDHAARQTRNVIVRPLGPGVTFTQLDDIKGEPLALLAPPVFLILETSPGNFQAWLALAGDEDKEFTRRVKRGTGADQTEGVGCSTARRSCAPSCAALIASAWSLVRSDWSSWSVVSAAIA
jgi:RepB DNA-primase from phage plasmid